MKSCFFLLFALLLSGGSALAQADTNETGGIGKIVVIKKGQPEIIIIPHYTFFLEDAMREIETSRKLTDAGIGLGSIANLTLVINAGVLSGNVEDWQIWPYLTGITISLGRGVMSFMTPNHLKKAEQIMRQPLEMYPDDPVIENSLDHIMTARRLSIAVPLLGVVAWCMIPTGVLATATDNEYGIYCYAVGWMCAAASLTCTFISSHHISKAKKGLSAIDLGVNNNGIGLSYHF
jgi:hypothetical protein